MRVARREPRGRHGRYCRPPEHLGRDVQLERFAGSENEGVLLWRLLDEEKILNARTHLDPIEERGVPCGENRWRETRESTIAGLHGTYAKGTLSPHSIRLVAPTALTLKAAGSSHGAHSKAAEVQSAGHQLAPLCDENSPIRARTRARIGPKNPRAFAFVVHVQRRADRVYVRDLVSFG